MCHGSNPPSNVRGLKQQRLLFMLTLHVHHGLMGIPAPCCPLSRAQTKWASTIWHVCSYEDREKGKMANCTLALTGFYPEAAHITFFFHFIVKASHSIISKFKGKGQGHPTLCLEEECLFLSVRSPGFNLWRHWATCLKHPRKSSCFAKENNKQNNTPTSGCSYYLLKIINKEILMGVGRDQLYWFTAQIWIIHTKAPLATSFWLPKAPLLIHF